MPEGDPATRPSPWFDAHLDALRTAGRLGAVLDLACGRGRHALPGVRAGLPLVGLDRSAAFLATLRRRADALGEDVPCVRADLETGHGIPIRAGGCGAVIVFRYLHRPLAGEIERVLAPGGVLLYETFTLAQRELPYGPSNPDFLLAPDELPTLFPGLETTAYEETRTGGPRPDAVARLFARRPAA